MSIITTGDGSHTLFSEQFQDVYHSRHGALRESEYVFLQQGLTYYLNRYASFSKPETIRIFEVGFGTGLNALLTMLEAEKKNISIDFSTIENYPLPIETIKALNYTERLGFEYCYGPYHSLHLVRWNEKHPVTTHFSFTKIQASLLSYQNHSEPSDLIYFDAFSPDTQPELWTPEVMKKMFAMLQPDGLLVSYCSKSSFQKALKEAGFRVEKLPGPPGKREMIRAHKD